MKHLELQPGRDKTADQGGSHAHAIMNGCKSGSRSRLFFVSIMLPLVIGACNDNRISTKSESQGGADAPSVEPGIGHADAGLRWESGDLEAEWARILDLELNRADSAKMELQRAMRESRHEPVRALSKCLLEEWELPPAGAQKREPRLVWAPAFDPDKYRDSSAPIPALSIWIKGVVTKSGHFERLTFVHSKYDTEMGRAVLESAKSVRYRPARCTEKEYCDCEWSYYITVHPTG